MIQHQLEKIRSNLRTLERVMLQQGVITEEFALPDLVDSDRYLEQSLAQLERQTKQLKRGMIEWARK